MTKLFICILYVHSQRDNNIKTNGMDQYEIWQIMKYQAFDSSIVPVILNRLISNGIRQGLIKFDSVTRRVIITQQGNQWCEDINYRMISGVFD